MISGTPAGSELRRHPRTDTTVPVAFALGEVVASESAYLNNISEGGASFNSMIELAPGTMIMMHFPPGKPALRSPARVVWCRQMTFQYVVGVEFVNCDPQFHLRLVQAVQEIGKYQIAAEREGRLLDVQHATLEWFKCCADDFFRSWS